MEHLRTLVLNLASQNPKFTNLIKNGHIVKTFHKAYDEFMNSDPESREMFLNLKTLEVAFLEAYSCVENRFTVIFAVINLYAYHNRIRLPYLLIKGAAYGLKLFLANCEPDVLELAQNQVIEFCRLLGLDELLLLCNPLRLNEAKNKKVVADYIRTWFNKKDSKAFKLVLKLVSRFELQNEPEIPDLLVVAVKHDYVDLCLDIVRKNKALSIFLLKNLKPAAHNVYMRRIIKDNGFDPKEFPSLLEFQRYGYFRYSVREFGYSKCEEIAKCDKEDFEVFLKVLVDMKKYNEAHSVLKRSPFQFKNYLSKKLSNGSEYTYIENELIQVDNFLPSSINKGVKSNLPFLTLEELGYAESDIIVVNQQNLKEISEKLLKAERVGMDGEFYTENCTNFGDNEMAIFQIATDHFVYIFDCIELKTSFQFIYFFYNFFKSKDIIKIGHSFHSDLKVIKTSFKINNFEANRVINIEKLVCEKQTMGLARMVESVLNKSLCKLEQTSCWRNRPLRRAQLHYAALDAASLLKLYDVLATDENIACKLNPSSSSKHEENQTLQHDTQAEDAAEDGSDLIDDQKPTKD